MTGTPKNVLIGKSKLVLSMNKKLGYYICNGQEFESKILACMESESTGKKVSWMFNDREFNRYNWTIEPTQTLDELYDKRSRELREKYNYIVLSYSGGSDSNNVLESFVRQGLHIDEIVTNWSLDASKDFTLLDHSQQSAWNVNAEWHLHTRHRLDYVKKVLPRTKITFLDTSSTIIESFNSFRDESWILDKKDVINPWGAYNYNWTWFSDVKKTFDHEQNIGIIIGADKIKVQLTNNKFYMNIMDSAANSTQLQNHFRDYTNAELVYYYWDGDCTDMLCKQAHTVRNWAMANPQTKSIFSSTDPIVLRKIQEKLLKTILYTTWDPAWFQVDKSLSSWDSEFDYWFTRGRQQTQEFKIWRAGLDHIAAKTQSHIRRLDDGTLAGLSAFKKQYYIGDEPVSI